MYIYVSMYVYIHIFFFFAARRYSNTDRNQDNTIGAEKLGKSSSASAYNPIEESITQKLEKEFLHIPRPKFRLTSPTRKTESFGVRIGTHVHMYELKTIVYLYI
jgi:hypothetical protein